MITGPLFRSQHKEEEEEESISLGRPAGGGLGQEQQIGEGAIWGTKTAAGQRRHPQSQCLSISQIIYYPIYYQ